MIIPKENEKDLAEVPDNVKAGLNIVPVSSVGEVLKVALVRQPEAIDWIEPEGVAPMAIADADDPVVDPLTAVTLVKRKARTPGPGLFTA